MIDNESTVTVTFHLLDAVNLAGPIAGLTTMLVLTVLMELKQSFKLPLVDGFMLVLIVGISAHLAVHGALRILNGALTVGGLL